MKIAGKLALITGASSGIGAATARELARRGARVALLARRVDALEAVAAEIRDAGGAAEIYPADLGDGEAVARTAESIQFRQGTPDIVVHGAGAGRWLFVDETNPDEMEQMMAVPYFGAFYLTRALLPGMMQRRSGHFVTVGSPATLLMWPGAAAYIAARWALHGFTEALRADVRGLGIDVTLILPGKVESEYFAHNPGTRERLPKVTYWTRSLSPEDVARAVARGVERRKRKIVIPFGLRLLALGNAMFPSIGGWVGGFTGAKRAARTVQQEGSCLSSR